MTGEDRFPVKRWIHKRLAILNFKNFLFHFIFSMAFYIFQPLALFGWFILTLIHLMVCLKLERIGLVRTLIELDKWYTLQNTQQSEKKRREREATALQREKNDDPVKIAILLFIAVGHLAYISSNRSVPIYSIHYKMFAGPYMPSIHASLPSKILNVSS